MFNLIVDSAPPGPSVIAIASTDGTVFVPASATEINYTVTFSEAVNGVDAADFELAATGTASGAITAVVPILGGTSYTVTIGALAGDGKLGLNLKASGTGIQNGGGVAIAAGFTGEAITLDHTLPAAPAGLALDPSSDSGIPGDGLSNVATPTVSGNAEAGATITLYDTDGSTVLGSIAADGGGKWSITSTKLGEGAHTLTAVQTDTAGNQSVASTGLRYSLDIQAPTTIGLSTTTLTEAAATSGSTLATLSALDATAVSYVLATGDGINDADNASFSIAGNNLVAAQNLAPGDYRIYVGAVDAAGNTGNQLFTITVSDAPAVASIVRAASAPATVPASATSVDFTVTFNQAVNGVDAGDFTLTSKGSAAGAIDAVTDSGDGATYTITVDTLGGDGELRLDLNASGTGIESDSKVAITGGYTGGASYQLDHTAPHRRGRPRRPHAGRRQRQRCGRRQHHQRRHPDHRGQGRGVGRHHALRYRRRHGTGHGHSQRQRRLERHDQHAGHGQPQRERHTARPRRQPVGAGRRTGARDRHHRPGSPGRAGAGRRQ